MSRWTAARGDRRGEPAEGAGSEIHAPRTETESFALCSVRVAPRWCLFLGRLDTGLMYGSAGYACHGSRFVVVTSMVLVGGTGPTSPRPPVDGVVAALSRLIVVSRAGYREPLLDALFVYRRREGLFIDGERIPPKLFRKTRPPVTPGNVRTFPVSGLGSGGKQNEEPALASNGTAGKERARSSNSRRSRRLGS